MPIPISTGWLIGSCMEAKGKQDLWIRQNPEVIALPREQAVIQSVESSNRIEGVTIAANRLNISLERLIEEQKEKYDDVLGRCSQGWHEGENDILPWLNYFLRILRQAYREFEEMIISTEKYSAKSDYVRQLICSQVEQFTLTDLARQLPSVSSQLIKKILAELKSKGIINLRGRGRGARWQVLV